MLTKQQPTEWIAIKIMQSPDDRMVTPYDQLKRTKCIRFIISRQMCSVASYEREKESLFFCDLFLLKSGTKNMAGTFYRRSSVMITK